MAIKISGDTVIYDDKVFNIASEKPVSPVENMVVYNADEGYYEIYKGSSWTPFFAIEQPESFTGEILYSYIDKTSPYVKLDGSVVLQSTYPNTYNNLGLVIDGDTNDWTVRTSGNSTDVYALTYGNGLYVYAGRGGVLGTSTDATTWTTRTSGTGTAIRTVTYGNGLYVYGGDGGVLATSTDAITWTARTSGINTRIRSLIYGNGLYVYGGDIRRGTSTDAINWTFYIDSSTTYSIIYNQSLGLFVRASTFSTTGYISTSTNGISWTTRHNTGTDIHSVVYGNGLFVYAGKGGVLGTSTDVITWTVRTSGTNTDIYALTYANGLFVYGGAGGLLSTSTDGITWTARTSGTGTQINTLTYGIGTYAFGTAEGTIGTNHPFTYDVSTEFLLLDKSIQGTFPDSSEITVYDAYIKE